MTGLGLMGAHQDHPQSYPSGKEEIQGIGECYKCLHRFALSMDSGGTGERTTGLPNSLI